MDPDERLRLFLGLRLPEPALDAVEAWQKAHLERMRIVPRGHVHLTLAFLGHRPAGELPAIVEALRGAAAGVSEEIRLIPVRYRETRSVAMLVCDDEGGRAVAEEGERDVQVLAPHETDARQLLALPVLDFVEHVVRQA